MALTELLPLSAVPGRLCQFANLSRFINSSCRPNLGSWLDGVFGERRALLWSTKPVQRGEELTLDYAIADDDQTPSQGDTRSKRGEECGQTAAEG